MFSPGKHYVPQPTRTQRDRIQHELQLQTINLVDSPGLIGLRALLSVPPRIRVSQTKEGAKHDSQHNIVETSSLKPTCEDERGVLSKRTRRSWFAQ